MMSAVGIEYDYLRAPSDFYLTRMQQHAAERIAQISELDHTATGAHSGVSEQLVDKLEAIVDSQSADVIDLMHAIHADPEVVFDEHRSAGRVADLLRAYGYEPEVGVCGLDTAIRAEFSTPGYDPNRHRTIGILAEYDALVGLGHACGHNVIAAAGAGAATALRELLSNADSAPGARVIFLGTPAEEGRSGKEYMAQAGAYDELDAAIMVHPSGNDVSAQVWLGRRVLCATFRGISSHASAQPYQARNALDAATLAYQAIGLLRQHMLLIDRVHAVILEGGKRASIILDESRLDLYVRSEYPESLLDLSERVEKILQGAALMTETHLRLDWDDDPPSLPVRNNLTLAERWARAEQRRGRRPLPAGTLPDTQAASTDFGNVSYRVPGIHPVVKIAASEVALHTTAFAEAADSPTAEAGAVDAAFGLAAAALDFLADDALAQAVKQEFDEAGGKIDVRAFFRR